MAIPRIQTSDYNSIYVQAAPDTLVGTLQENKAIFDAFPLLIKDFYNNAADNIGFTSVDQQELEDIFRAKGMTIV